MQQFVSETRNSEKAAAADQIDLEQLEQPFLSFLFNRFEFSSESASAGAEKISVQLVLRLLLPQVVIYWPIMQSIIKQTLCRTVFWWKKQKSRNTKSQIEEQELRHRKSHIRPFAKAFRALWLIFWLVDKCVCARCFYAFLLFLCPFPYWQISEADSLLIADSCACVLVCTTCNRFIVGKAHSEPFYANQSVHR